MRASRRASAALMRAGAAVVLAALALAAVPGTAQTPRPAAARPPGCEGPPGVPAARLAALARGFNLTGWLDSEPAQRPDPTTLADLRMRGFTHVRLPVTAEFLMPAFSQPGWVAWASAELDRALERLFTIGFAVSIDLHPGEKFGNLYRTDPKRAFELLEPTWRRLAHRYANRPPDRLLFEALNEPTADRAIWNADGPRLVEAIRREAPAHTIVYGATNYQRIDQLIDLAPLPDPNTVYAVHFYDPMMFTHQGLTWAPEDPLRYLEGVPFPVQASDPAITRLFQTLVMQGHVASAAQLTGQLQRPWTEERVEEEFAQAQAWAIRHNRAVIVNEFGVLSWKAPPESRIRWLTAVRRAAERHCIGWTHWEYAEAFGFIRRGDDGREHADEAVVRALLGKPANSE
jgi:endoglucanase